MGQLSLGVAAPDAPQGAPLEKHRGSGAVTVHKRPGDILEHNPRSVIRVRLHYSSLLLGVEVLPAVYTSSKIL